MYHSLPHSQHQLPEGYIVTTNEPTLTHHHHPKPTVFIWVHSWCCTFSRLAKSSEDFWNNETVLCDTMMVDRCHTFVQTLLGATFKISSSLGSRKSVMCHRFSQELQFTHSPPLPVFQGPVCKYHP